MEGESGCDDEKNRESLRRTLSGTSKNGADRPNKKGCSTSCR